MSSARGGGGGRKSSRRSKSPDAGAGEAGSPGLRTLVQRRIIKDVFQAAADKHPGWKVLIVDDHAMRVISSAVGMYDIMERKVTLVESLTKKRAPFPDQGAIYFLEPSKDSVERLIADFSSTGKVLYGNNVFLYFLERLPDRLLDQIKACRPLLKRIKALSEINIDFLAKEERAFSFDMHDTFATFYLRKGASPIELEVAQKLVTACATLNEFPHIRYKQSSAICTSLASVFSLKMEEFISQNPNWWYHGGPSQSDKGSSSQTAQRERATLLLLDRADDCLTPIMHDFNYQSMVHDLLPMDGDRITFQNESTDDPSQTEAKDVLLDEKDNLWVELRGKHIAEVIETLSNRIREIMNSSTGSTLNKKSGESGQMSLSQMASALKALPEYREVMSKLSQHMHISHECMDVFKQENLLELSELEQTLATGKDEDGRSPKLADMIDTAEELIMKMDKVKDRLRIILVLTISQGGLRQQDRRRLMNVAELSRKDMRTLNSLEILGLSIFSSNEKNKLVTALPGRTAGAEEESEYASSRYVPLIKSTLEDLAGNMLSMEDYPSVMPMPDQAPAQSSGGGLFGGKSARGGSGAGSSARSGAGAAKSARGTGGASSKWSKPSSDPKRTAGPTNFTGGRSIVFMVGGASYAELRTARKVMESTSREIVMGSTHFISPHMFLEDLEALAQEED